MDLNIIIVWYNEERNIPKMFEHLKYLRSKIECRIIYIDQESTDNSVRLMKKWWAEVYEHKNLWTPDPDKKRAVENLCWDKERCFILDCDEELSNEMVDNIYEIINKNDIMSCYSFIRNMYWMWIIVNSSNQLRLFTKKSVILSTEVHNYINPANNSNHININLCMNEIDKKLEWKSIFVVAEKNNRYSDLELKKHKNISKWNIIRFMVRKPVLWFFWFWIRYKLFFKWLNWWIYCKLMAQYQFLIYAKLKEKTKYNNL